MTLLRIEFIHRENGPKNLLCEAEIHFDEGILKGCKLVGFTLWTTDGGRHSAGPEVSVTMPSRAWGQAGERKFFDLLRPSEDPQAIRDLKAQIITEYCDQMKRVPR